VAAGVRGGANPRPSALRWATTPTPLGQLIVAASEAGVVETAFVPDDEEVAAAAARLEERRAVPIRRTPRDLASVIREVDGYFAGRVLTFSTPVDLTSMPDGFARRVLLATATIPYGELWTYGDVAERAGSRRAGRAAGNALRGCPIELFIPCHRVVHVGGPIRGYGRHEDRKRWLIRHEAEPGDLGGRTRGWSP
jgi:methylated-DNA-[protein]-cysteine S-methyltransferase